MGQLKLSRELEANLERLSANPYPGRGLVIGLNQRADMALQAYWVMGRSENSRNRILEVAGDIVRTAPHDPTKVTDTSLIIYNAMLRVMHNHVVSNGDQTDTVAAFVASGLTFERAVENRTYEPDAPNYTPRITGILDTMVPSRSYMAIATTRRSETTEDPVHTYFYADLGDYGPGLGHCVHTYSGDGDPLPSYKGEPFALPLGNDPIDSAEMLWQNLNADNRVAIAVKGINLATREMTYSIINSHERAIHES